MNELSIRLKEMIKKSGLSQRDLELKTGIPHSAIQRYAAGKTDRIPISRFESLASALGTTADYLLGWNKNNTTSESESGRANEFIKLFERLSDDQQKLIIETIKAILPNQ